ncbi:MAG: glycosyltransferase family 39 protein, partial [Chloroflexota bacterium]|nr:glycosyltransferase family 39 protein [Chloroflexota bacterium]
MQQASHFVPWVPLPVSEPVEQVGEDRRPADSRVWLGAPAFLVALVGTYLLSALSTRTWGEILLVLAALLAVGSLGGRPIAMPFGELSPPEQIVTWDRIHVVRFSGVALAALLIWQADSQYLMNPDEFFGAQGWLWLAGIACLLLSLYAWPNGAKDGRAEGALTTLPVRRHDRARWAKTEPWTRWEIAFFFSLVVLCIAVRIWRLADYPYAIHPDEITTGRIALQSYVGAVNPSIFGTLWNFINLPALWFLGVAQALKVGGVTLAALRFPAALFGAATVIPLYGLLRGTWGRWAAIAGSSMLAFNASNIHFSRVTLNNIDTQFFWATCFFFLLRGLQLRRPVDWALAGLFAGLGEHFYYGTRLLSILLVAFGIYLLVIHRRKGWRYLGHFGLLALGFLAGFGPLLAYFTRHPELYFGRGAGVLTWNHIPTRLPDLVNMWNTLWPLMSQNLLAISSTGGQDSVYFSSLMSPVEATLLVLGMALLIWRWRHPAAFLTLITGFGVLIVGGTLVPSSAFIAHWTPAFPSFFIAVGVPVGAWLGSIRRNSQLGRVVIPLVSFGLLLVAGLNLNFYFSSYNTGRPEFEVRAEQSRLQASLGTAYRVRNVGRTWQPYDEETNQYLIKGQDGAQLYNPAAELPLPGLPGGDSKGFAFFFFPDNEQYLSAVRDLFPGGKGDEVFSHNGTHLFYTYSLTPEQAKATYGVNFGLVATNGELLHKDLVPSVGSLPAGLSYPLEAQWSGALYMPSTEVYSLQAQGASAIVMLDGQIVPPTQNQMKQAGWHQVTVTSSMNSPQSLHLMLGIVGGEMNEVSPKLLWPQPLGSGLLGAVMNADPTRPALARVDPFIGFTAPGDPNVLGLSHAARMPTSVEWAGEVNSTPAGNYKFEVRTDGEANLTIDGHVVAVGCTG